MRIAVLGTGAVGRSVSRRLDELGHVVAVGLSTFAEAAAGAELVVNAAGGDVCLGILESSGAEHLADKVLHDLGHTDVIDLGELVSARGAETWLPLWIRLAMALGSSDFNIKVVRGPGIRR